MDLVKEDVLDELDRRIIDELRHDGRLANTELGRKLGVSESTIRNRVQRLINDGIIEIAARVNLSRLGYQIEVIIGVFCDPGSITSVAHQLAAIPEIRFVTYVTGRYDIQASASFRSRGDLLTFLAEKIGKIPGIRSTETLVELQVVKRNYYYSDVGPI